MNNKSFFTVALASAFAIPSIAVAQPNIQLNTLTAQWQNPVPAANATINNGGTPITARWGGVAANSGYDFTPRVTPLAIDLGGSSTFSFNLGTFTHQNFPIPAGSSITDIRLGVTLGFTGSAPATFSEFFNLTHRETTNSANPCANGGAFGVGINDNGCADEVSFTNPASSTAFEVDGQLYQLTLRGFSENANMFVGTTSFFTRENASNDAFLWADISLIDPAIVPEPATFALTMLGLVGIGAAARRRRKA